MDLLSNEFFELMQGQSLKKRQDSGECSSESGYQGLSELGWLQRFPRIPLGTWAQEKGHSCPVTHAGLRFSLPWTRERCITQSFPGSMALPREAPGMGGCHRGLEGSPQGHYPQVTPGQPR